LEIYIGNLPFDIEEGELRGLLEPYGECERVTIVVDRATGQNRGFGFAEFRDEEQARKAIGGINGMALRGRSLKANPSRGQGRGHSTYKTREGRTA